MCDFRVSLTALPQNRFLSRSEKNSSERHSQVKASLLRERHTPQTESGHLSQEGELPQGAEMLSPSGLSNFIC